MLGRLRMLGQVQGVATGSGCCIIMAQVTSWLGMQMRRFTGYSPRAAVISLHRDSSPLRVSE
jgi:hypothetical protein